MEQPVYYWDPIIAPSGMIFYTGKLFPAWQNSLFIGGLGSTNLVRLSVKGERSSAKSVCCRTCSRARAHPRRAAGTGRRDLPADRQRQGPDPEAGAQIVNLRFMDL